MKITVIGSGYVGLVAGACFAHKGITVCCVDKDAAKIASLKSGKLHIHEPGLEEIVASAIKSGHLTFSDSLNSIHDSTAIFLAVGTPSSAEGDADISGVLAAASEIAALATEGKIIVTKSTVPVGTATKLKNLFADLRKDVKFTIVSNPEFLREGSAVLDFLHPDRVVIGADDENAVSTIKKLYSAVVDAGTTIMFTDNQTAELIKYAANSYLAMRIAFINEIADLCEKIDADVDEVANGIGYDNRIGRNYLNAGPGYGGSCFPKDTLAISYFANAIGMPLKIINTVIESNDNRKLEMTKKVLAALTECKKKIVTVLGVTFKADTDDMRDSIALSVIPKLIEQGFKVKIYDPSHSSQARELFTSAAFCADIDSAFDGSEATIILTEWSEFKLLQPENFPSKIVVDLRNLYNKKTMRAYGIKYTSVGRN